MVVRERSPAMSRGAERRDRLFEGVGTVWDDLGAARNAQTQILCWDVEWVEGKGWGSPEEMLWV